MIEARKTIKEGFGWYQAQAGRTSLYDQAIDAIDPGVEAPVLRGALRLTTKALGLSEAGEVQGKIKKIIRDSGGILTEEHRAALRKEIGDAIWYLSEVAKEAGIDLGEAPVENLERLLDRQERGVL